MAELPWEDNLLERKLESDLKDLLKTLVAFANSVRPGHIATILIGERNDGSAKGVTNPDHIQKTVREKAEEIYPPIVWRSQVYEKEGFPCVRVEIEYSGETPHFGCAAWIRRGSVTVKATDEVFQQLIALRLGKVAEIAKWLNQRITIQGENDPLQYKSRPRRWPQETTVMVRSFNNGYWATFKDEADATHSEPLKNSF